MPVPGTYGDPSKTIPHAPQYPVITAIAVSAISDTGATITWTTDRASSSQVTYGISSTQDPLPQKSTYNATPVTSHSVTISGLTSGREYFFTVQSFYIDSLSISPRQSFPFILSLWDYWGQPGIYWGEPNTYYHA